MSLEQGAKVHGPWVPWQSIYPEPIILWHLCNKFTQVDALEKFHSCVVSTTLVLFLQHFCVVFTTLLCCFYNTLVLFLQHSCVVSTTQVWLQLQAPSWFHIWWGARHPNWLIVVGYSGLWFHWSEYSTNPWHCPTVLSISFHIVGELDGTFHNFTFRHIIHVYAWFVMVDSSSSASLEEKIT